MAEAIASAILLDFNDPKMPPPGLSGSPNRDHPTLIAKVSLLLDALTHVLGDIYFERDVSF